MQFLMGLLTGAILTIFAIAIWAVVGVIRAKPFQLVTLAHSQAYEPRWSWVLRLMVRWSEGELGRRGYDIMQARAFGRLREKSGSYANQDNLVRDYDGIED